MPNYHGGTVAGVMAEYNTAMARINGVFERDANITMQLVANNDQIIFLNAATDPFTNNNIGGMLDQNQSVCDNTIGTTNYDIGHVFSTGGSGVAYWRSACSTQGIKAGGSTGLLDPTGDPFWIDFVAHEMGHQFGASHTQNNDNCNRADHAAMEPGSASTIMGYAGICFPSVQTNSDDHFHAYSIQEMASHITGGGGTCATITPNGNNAPTVTISSGSYNVPANTPFVLTAIGSDPDSTNQLSYCWEQMDNQVAVMPPSPNSTGGPAFRSISPHLSPSRYFPNLNAVANNASPTWEVLPAVTRQMNFRCTARDNNIGGGCTSEADVTLNFKANVGPFLVTEPNTGAVVWTSNLMEMVEWDVANTNGFPINTSSVDIFLSVDGGQTYPYTLLTGTPNDGSQEIEVPDVETDEARVMVKGRNNVFFDISNQNFKIEAPAVPTFIMDVSPLSQVGCPGIDAVYNIGFESFLGFNENVSITATGVPAGATAAFSPNPANSTATASMTISGAENLMPDTYSINIEAVANGVVRNAVVELVILNEITSTVSLTSPPNGATGLAAVSTTFEWQPTAGATEYFMEVATDPGFQNLFFLTTTNETQITINAFEEGAVYYWRVNARNACMESGFTPYFAFQTGSVSCTVYESTDVPKPIPPNQTSVLQVGEDLPIISISLHTEITHTWVGDLAATITSQDGTTATLFDRPGAPLISPDGCDGDNMSVTLFDLAVNTATVLENTCGAVPPSIAGEFQPITPFSIFNGKNSGGDWVLAVDDLFPTEDNGTLQAWSLEICGAVSFPTAVLLQYNILNVPEGQSENITQAFLETQGIADQTNYLLAFLPQNGSLFLQGTALNIGDPFTQNGH